MGPVHQPARQPGTVERAVEQHERQVGERIVAVVVGDRTAEPGPQPWGEGVQGDGQRVRLIPGDAEQTAQGRVGHRAGRRGWRRPARPGRHQ